MDKNKLFSLFETSFPLLFLIPLAPYIGGMLFISKSLDGLFSFSSLLGLIAVSVFFVAGLNTFNAVFDHKIDLINKPFRGIPSNKITKKEALIFSLIYFGISLILSSLINLTFLALMFFNVILAILYSLPPVRLKEKYILSNITIALTLGFFPTLLGLSLFGKITNLSWPFSISVLILYTSISFLKDFEDFFGDKVYSVKTLPSVLGFDNARKWAIVSIALAYIFIIALTFLNIFKPMTYLMILFIVWVWFINNLLIRVAKGTANNLVLHMTFLASISVLSLAILNTII